MRKLPVPFTVFFLIHCLGLSLAPSTAVGAPPKEKSKYVVAFESGSTREGKTLTLLCVIGGPLAASINPPPSYVWIKDGKILAGETRKRLTLKSLRLQDEGVYQCGDPNSEVPREEYPLDVNSAQQKFYVTETGSRLRGKMLTLQCHPVGVDPSFFVWLKNGKAIPGESGRTFPLLIVTSEDTGDYQCGDSNPDIPRLIHHVEVLWTVPMPVVSKDRPPVSGRPFYLDCIIQADYPISGSEVYNWYNGSTEIKGQSGPKLSFDNLTEADADEYTCTARDGPMDTTSPHSQAFHLIPLVAPQVHIEPMSPSLVLKEILGENLTLTCEVTHAVPRVPDNGYSWSFLPSHHGPTLPLTETTRTLMLGPLTRKASGQYFCQAKNDQEVEDLTLAGQAFVTVEVVYLENFSTTPDLAVNENDPVILTCSADSYPTAHIAWTVDGQGVRRVVDNLDHYVIPSASCSNSANYTCYATNSDIPGLEKKGTTALLVNCRQEESTKMIGGPHVIQADIAAPFDFTLPKQDSVLVVHPAGQVIITVHSNCSFLIASAFESRCLHPHCDPASHHLTFTLTQVTDKDQGHYYCLEGKQRKTVPFCNQTLIKKEHPSEAQDKAWYFVSGIVGTLCGVVITVVEVIIMLRRKFKTGSSITESDTLGEYSMLRSSGSASSVQAFEGSHDLETLYEKGNIYVFPTLVPIEHQEEVVGRESSPLLTSSEGTVQGESAFAVTNLLRSTLQGTIDTNDLPSFILHNTRLSTKDNVILLLSRKVGVVVMIVKALKDAAHLNTLQTVVEHLVEALKIVKEKLNELVQPDKIAAVLALPNLPEPDNADQRKQVKILESNGDVELLLGREKEKYKQWAERLKSRPDCFVWKQQSKEENSLDTAFEKTVSKFLTLAGSYHPRDSPTSHSTAETWLLTRDQMEVRDSTAKLLHICGPPGSGKTMLLIHKAREWLADGKAVVIAVGREIYDAMLSHVVGDICREQTEETLKKLRVCRTYQALQNLVQELRQQFPNVETCIVVHTVRDKEMLSCMLQAVEIAHASAIWSVSAQNLSKIDETLSKSAHALGWAIAKLSHCIRCTTNTVELLNLLAEGLPDQDRITSCSTTSDQGMTNWEVLDHSLHPDHIQTMFNCDNCKDEMNEALPLQTPRLDWKRWIALHTGDPSIHSDIQVLCNTLKSFGVPTILDDYDSAVASHDSQLEASITGKADWWKRVVNGVDEKGEPAVHLVRVKDLLGLEKGNVLLVHWDERDNDPALQSREKRDQRLDEHRRQWMHGVSRSKGQVVFLLLTPSPARSLLSLPEAVLPVP